MNGKSLRRMRRFLTDSVRKLRFDVLLDPRCRKDRRSSGRQTVTAVVVGMLCGKRGLCEVESLIEMLPRSARLALKLRRHTPDTTLRDWLCRLDWKPLRAMLVELVRDKSRAKALRPVALPLGVVSMDGKATALPTWEGPFAQRHQREGAVPYGLIRTVTSVLCSARGAPCIDVMPIPSETNEMGVFQAAFNALFQAHHRLFQLVCYDAGANSEANGAHVVSRGKDYLFAMNNQERHMQQLAMDLLEHAEVQAEVENIEAERRVVTRRVKLFSVNRGLLPKGTMVRGIWEHTQTLIAIETLRDEAIDVRYFCTSLPKEALTPHQWIELIVLRWAVETCHQLLDGAFAEDDRPWIRNDPRGMLAVLILRRIAYTLVRLYREITLRAEILRQRSTTQFLRTLSVALITASPAFD